MKIINNLRLKLILITVLWTASFSQLLHAQSLTASVDRTAINLTESLLLNIVAKDISTLQQPDFTLLAKEFDILAKSVNHSIESVNGDSKQSINWQLQLQAKTQGKLSIPSFSLLGSISEAIVIDVSPTTVSDEQQQDFHLQLITNKDTAVVNEQILVTLRFSYASNVSNLQRSDLLIENVNLVKLEDRQYETIKDGRAFGVYEISYAVFAKQQGLLQIPAQQLSVRLGRSSVFTPARGKVISLQSEPLQVTINKLVDSKGSTGLLVADKLQLLEKWTADSDQISLGDSITREISLQLTGALAQTITPLSMQEISGVKIYPEPAIKSEQKSDRGLISSRSRSFAIVPTAIGEYQLPPIKIKWWNTVSQQIETAELKSRTVKVVAGLNAAKTTQAIESVPQTAITAPRGAPVEIILQPNPVNTWLLWLSSVLTVVVMSLIWLLYRGKFARGSARVTAKNVQKDIEPYAFEQLLSALTADNNLYTHRQLLQWLHCCYENKLLATASIATLQQHCDADLQRSIEHLEQSLYGKSEQTVAWDRSRLRQQFKALRKQLQAQYQQKTPITEQALPSLYPQFEVEGKQWQD
ncbi:MAG: hypothetical protein OFPI_18040 [Osedax symbiont Rs2]|nr:MAG: hypothetical protein OFPI_18040 [Osedax symbiont Rs2]